MKLFFRNRLSRIEYSTLEWTIMRVGFAVILWMACTQLAKTILPYDEIRRPHGIGHWIDVGFVGLAPYETLFPAIFYGLVVVYALNLLPVVTLSGLVVLHTLMGTFTMSQGATHHVQQIIGIVLLGQWLAAIWDLARQPGWFRFLCPTDAEFRRRIVYWSQQMIAAGYVVTGLTKIVRSEGRWLQEIPNLVVQFEKNLLMAHYNRLEPVNDKVTEGTVAFMTHFPFLAQVAFGGVLLLELLAFLGLFNRSIMALWGAGLIAMHLGIGIVMKLHFLYNQQILFLFFVNLPFWIWALWQWTAVSGGKDRVREQL